MLSEQSTRKLVILGDCGVGKTCFCLNYATGQFPTDFVPLVFDGYATRIILGDSVVNLGFFDTCATEEYDRLRPLAYPQTDVFLLCFAVDSRASLDRVLTKWYPEISLNCPQVPSVLLGLKGELYTSQNLDRKSLVTSEEAWESRRKIGASTYIECSARSGNGVRDAVRHAAEVAFERRQQPPRGSRRCKCYGSRCSIL